METQLSTLDVLKTTSPWMIQQNLHKENLSIREVLSIFGIDEAIKCLKNVKGHDKEIRLFACDCAESVIHFYESAFPENDILRKVILLGRKYANGGIDKDDEDFNLLKKECTEIHKNVEQERLASYDKLIEERDRLWSISKSIQAVLSCFIENCSDAAFGASWDACSANNDNWHKEKLKQTEYLLRYI